MSNEVKEAMDVIKQAMKDDPAYAYSWHANIAMMCHDSIEGMAHGESVRTGNEAARRFMKLCFGVETSQNMLLD